MKDIRSLILVLDNQLNMDSLIWQGVDASQDCVLIAEVADRFTERKLTQNRAVLQISAMRHFGWDLWNQDYDLIYYPLAMQLNNLWDALETALQEVNPQLIRCVTPDDFLITVALNEFSTVKDIPIQWFEDDHLVAQQEEFESWLQSGQTPDMDRWYQHLRKTRHVLVNEDGSPKGGCWQYESSGHDTCNHTAADTRETCHSQRTSTHLNTDEITQQSYRDVRHFLPYLPDSKTALEGPVTHQEAMEVLEDFVSNQLPDSEAFAPIWRHQPSSHTAAIAFCLDHKLLSPAEVIGMAEQAYQAQQASLPRTEEFIRYILGWREYMRACYRHNLLHRMQGLPA